MSVSGDSILVEEVAKAIYWVGYSERGRPHNFTPEVAFNKAGKVQQDFCRKQAFATIRRILGDA